MWKIGTLIHCLVGIQYCAAALENSMAFFRRLNELGLVAHTAISGTPGQMCRACSYEPSIGNLDSE